MESVILALARTQTAIDLAVQLATALGGLPTVLSRVWLVQQGELVSRGSAGTPTGGGSYNRTDGGFSRLRVGQGKIGETALTRRAMVVRSIRGDEEWLANPSWIARQGVRAFTAYPLAENDQTFGVLAVFDRTAPSDADLRSRQFLADFAGIRLAQLAAATRGPAGPPPGLTNGAEGLQPTTVLTRAALKTLERDAIMSALARTHGKVFGADGAATLLGMRPTTLASRIKALGIERMR